MRNKTYIHSLMWRGAAPHALYPATTLVELGGTVASASGSAIGKGSEGTYVLTLSITLSTNWGWSMGSSRFVKRRKAR